MIWALLVLVGVPLWLCAMAILALVVRNRSLRRRDGDLGVRVRADSARRWRRGHALWIHDVFSFRGSPAAWTEALDWVTAATARDASTEEAKGLHRLGDHPVIVHLRLAGGDSIDVAARAEDRVRVLGPLGPVAQGPAGAGATGMPAAAGDRAPARSLRALVTRSG